MSQNLPLRDYQQECLDDNERDLAAGDNRLMNHGATGLGKTVIMTHQANGWAKKGKRTLVIAHRKELITQTINKFQKIAPEIPVGRVQALSGLSRADRARQVSADNGVLVGSIQSLLSAAAISELPQIDRLTIDEAHHSAADTYMNLMEMLGSWRGLPTIGYSATPSRADKRNLGDTWKLSWRRDIRFGIKHGHLVNLVGKTTPPLKNPDGTDFNLAKVRRAYVEEAAGVDFVPSALASAMEAIDAEAQIAKLFNVAGRGDDGEIEATIGFCPSVPFCYSLQAEFTKYGIRSEVIEGKTAKEDRDRWLEEFEAGELPVLLNFNVLTEGTDLPRTRIILMIRPTTSTPLFTQCVGRGTRPSPETGKTVCKVIDVVGVSRQHDLASLADLATTPIDIQEGETLYDAMLRADEEAGLATSPALVEGGVLELEDFDFFAKKSRRVWLPTPAGCRFTPSGNHAYVAVPQGEHGLYILGRSPDPKTKVKGETLRRDLTLAEAMDYGDSFADEEERDAGVFASSYGTSKDASWRQGNRPPTLKQLQHHRDNKMSKEIPNPGSMTKKELSDAISIVHIARRYDRMVTATKRSA